MWKCSPQKRRCARSASKSKARSASPPRRSSPKAQPVRLPVAVPRFMPRGTQRCATLRRAAALPNDTWANRLSSCGIPKNDGFALIGDRQPSNFRRRRLTGQFGDHFHNSPPNVDGGLFRPAGTRIGNAHRTGCPPHDRSGSRNQQRLGVGRALVDREYNRLRHHRARCLIKPRAAAAIPGAVSP